MAELAQILEGINGLKPGCKGCKGAVFTKRGEVAAQEEACPWVEVAPPSRARSIAVTPAYCSMWLTKFCPECIKCNMIKFQFNVRQKAATSACTNAAVMSVIGE